MIRRFLLTALACIAMTVSIPAFAQQAGVTAPNVVPITPQLTTSGQPTRESLASLGAAGYQGVIYLAPLTVPDAVPDEAAILRRQGISFTNIPITFNQPGEKDFEAFTDALAGLQGKKVLVHCQVNMRASSMVFLYRVIVGKENPEAAYPSVSKVWTPDGRWKNFIVATLKKHGVDFEPY
ncbi:protein tyrosine phosphatase family protein [Caenimonas aquaedulcis]|uniref:Protein tyrosine phosphatase family protein n=1 Tax=Caenimonas aquaedulcis TaxID=2793270 RepID=A0A931H739_9BURK|nr:protein tyrosine phosphatase family protein [Caenimonas aquaedulcis]MBG9389894.1 protein tyrosine phosphatase family protein [Caenimonas aquaedulcis]